MQEKKVKSPLYIAHYTYVYTDVSKRFYSDKQENNDANKIQQL